jgi:hypothetical protein
MEGALPCDREFVALARLSFGKAALGHDRRFEPGIVGHRDILGAWRRCKSRADIG